MKKLLIGTSALVAAASFVGAAWADDGIKLSVGGFGKVYLGYGSQDDAFIKATGKEVTAVDVKGNNEIHFKGSTTLDNGLTVDVKYELEAGGTGASRTDPTDEYSVTVSGGFGSIVVGADDSIADSLNVEAPTVGMFGNGDSVGNYVIVPDGDDAFGDADTGISFGGDSESITYVSPQVMGFTFGATYMPDAGGDDNDALPVGKAGKDDKGEPTWAGSDEAYFAALKWEGEVAPDLTLTVQGAYGWEDTNTNLNNKGGHDEWQGGLNVGYAGFTFGGAYRQATFDGYDKGTVKDDELTSDVWEMAVSYETGPYGVSLSYIEGSAENEDKGVSDDSRKVWALSGEYAMGPGIKMIGGIAYADFENGTASGANKDTKDKNQNSGIAVATGLKLTF